MNRNVVVHTWATHPVCVLALEGSMHLPDVAVVMGRLTRAFEEYPHHTVVCDVSRLEASASDAVLTAFPASLRRAGGWPRADLHLAAPGPALARQLRRTRMGRYLRVHATLGDALALARADRMPLRAPLELSLAPEPGSLATVREAVRDLWPAAATHSCDEVLVVVNELAANAVRHVTEPYRVSLVVGVERATVAVTDRSPRQPVLRTPGPHAAGGRGMHLVAALSRDWGVRLVHRNGKTVWADLAGPGSRVPRARSSTSS